jgi:nucleoid-associated protein YgaU
LAEAQAKAEEAKKAEANRQHAAAADTEPDGEPSAEPMPPEAIPSPGTDAAQKLPPSTSPTTSGEESDSDLQEEAAAQAPVGAQQKHAKHAHRSATRRWMLRMRRDRCPSAGHRITPPGYYRVQSGDSLWRISRRHYRAGARYRRIYRANRSRIRNPNLIYPCQVIFVPRRR